MASNFQPREVQDGVFSFSLGQNTSVDPISLPKNQLARLTNGSTRGTFISNRPKYRKIEFDFNGDAELETAFTEALWQNGTYYKPDSDPEGFVVSIGGRLHQVTPSSLTATVVDRTIPGDLNPPDLVRAWLWQAENFVIVQNGQNPPLFFNGLTTRRSLSYQFLYGTTSANFTVPEKFTVFNGDAAVVTVALTGAFLGNLDDAVFINGRHYQVVPTPGTSQATLTNVSDVAGTVYPVGTQININPNVFGIQATTLPFSNEGTTYSSGGVIITLTLTADYTGPDNVFVSLFGIKWKVQSHSGVFVAIRNQQSWTVPASLDAGTLILNFPGTSPVTQVAVLATAYTAPAIGSSSAAIIVDPYAGVAGQSVYLTGGAYNITAVAAAPIGSSVSLRNVDDTPGATVLTGSSLLAISEIPPGRMGIYFRNRNWFALTDGRRFMASDIVGGSSGTQTLDYRDAILRISENNYLAGGGYFSVPGYVGDIRFIKGIAILDTAMGHGPVQVGTPNGVFSVNSPMERLTWQDMTNPILTDSLVGSGGLGQDSTVNNNNDLEFRSTDGFRSLKLARQEFDKPGNVPQSREVQDTLDADDQSLLEFGSSIIFQNRKIDTANPFPVARGVYHNKLVIKNLDPNSSLGDKKNPIFDGTWDGLNVLKLFVGQFNGVERAFAFCLSTDLDKIELWEILPDNAPMLATDTNPITTTIEFPAIFTNQRDKSMFDYGRLIDGEIHVRDLIGEIEFRAYYRPDFDTNWTPWHSFSVKGGITKPQYRVALGLGEPSPEPCDSITNKPNREGYHFQVKLAVTITGTGRFKFMGERFKLNTIPAPKFSVPLCPPLDPLPDLQPITGLRVEFRNGVYVLTWNEYPGVTCYNVWMGDELMGECVEENTFTPTIPPGQPPEPFTVTPVTPDGEGPPSPPVSAPPPPPPLPPGTVIYHNTAQTAHCGLPCTGDFTIEANVSNYDSTVSQADADAKALAAAQDQLVCELPEDYYETAGSEQAGYPANPGVVPGCYTPPGAFSPHVNYKQVMVVIFNNSALPARFTNIAPTDGTYQTFTIRVQQPSAGETDLAQPNLCTDFTVDPGNYIRAGWTSWFIYNPVGDQPLYYPLSAIRIDVRNFTTGLSSSDTQDPSGDGETLTFFVDGEPECGEPT